MRRKPVSPELLRQLREAGTISASNCDDGSRQRIVIRQQLEGVNLISDTSCGLVRYVIQVRIASSLSMPFSVFASWIETPWGDYINWLEDPGPGRPYQLPEDSTQYMREDVLNHRELIIRPGRVLSGIFLGMGTAHRPIPRDHTPDQPLMFVIEDDFGKRYSEEIFTSIDRSERLDSRLARAGRSQRGSSVSSRGRTSVATNSEVYGQATEPGPKSSDEDQGLGHGS